MGGGGGGGTITLENKAYFILGNCPLTQKKYSNFAANQRISKIKGQHVSSLFELVKKNNNTSKKRNTHFAYISLFYSYKFQYVVFETMDIAQKEKIRRGSGQVLF